MFSRLYTRLKSDQNGIEMKLKATLIEEGIVLKSDQNGIEIYLYNLLYL